MRTIAQALDRALTEDRATTRPTTVEWKFGFKTFNDPILNRALAEAQRFIDDMANNREPRWLTFIGKSGTGKTHLAKQLMRYWREVGKWYVCPRTGANLVKNGIFKSWPRVADDMKQGDYGPIDDLSEFDFAVIDEIGAEYDPSGFVVSKLDGVLNSRLRKWTVITSNMSVSEISQKLDVRIASRLRRGGGAVVEMLTKDFNLR